MTNAGQKMWPRPIRPPPGRGRSTPGCAKSSGSPRRCSLYADTSFAVGARQPGCKALQGHYGIGGLLSVAIWEELGDCRRFTSSDDAVRHTGLDVTVWSSDGKRTRGHLAKQGPPVLRWALYEAAVYAARPTSADYAYYRQLRQRLEAHLALITIARKLARRCYHTLRNVGDAAYPIAA